MGPNYPKILKIINHKNKKQMIKIKNKMFNYSKVVSLDFAQNEASKKNWLIVNLTTEKDNKVFIEVKDETEYHNMILDIVNQIKGL
jgi:hypothetical protein